MTSQDPPWILSPDWSDLSRVDSSIQRRCVYKGHCAVSPFFVRSNSTHIVMSDENTIVEDLVTAPLTPEMFIELVPMSEPQRTVGRIWKKTYNANRQCYT